MQQVFIYCRDQGFRAELERSLENCGYGYETTSSSFELAERAVRTRPQVLILCLNGEGERCDKAVAAIRSGSPETKIIYATRHPSKNDVKTLEHGIFYYAADASLEEIVLAVKAALERKEQKRR